MADSTIASQTLRALEERLGRIQFLLHGDGLEKSNEAQSDKLSVTARLERLENSLANLRHNSDTVQQLLQLHSSHSESFEARKEQSAADEMSQSTLAALVLSHAPSYQSAASQLTSLNDLPIPDASGTTNLISLEPRMRALSAKGATQEQQVESLQTRSANLVARWHEIGVLSMGECWTEWEGRLMATEQKIRREQAARKREQEAL